MQSLGAAGNLVKAFLTISGAGTGAAAEPASRLPSAQSQPFSAWSWWPLLDSMPRGNKLCRHSDITADVLKEASGLFGELRQFWAEIAPDIKAITRDLFSGINDIIQVLFGAVWFGLARGVGVF